MTALFASSLASTQLLPNSDVVIVLPAILTAVIVLSAILAVVTALDAILASVTLLSAKSPVAIEPSTILAELTTESFKSDCLIN